MTAWQCNSFINHLKFLEKLAKFYDNLHRLTEAKRGVWVPTGGTYSHTKGDHGVEVAFGPYDGHLWAGHGPDRINVNDFNLSKYKQYVTKLFEALGGDTNDPAQKAQLDAILQKASELPTDQTRKLMQWRRLFGSTLSIQGITCQKTGIPRQASAIRLKRN